jgi:hypothetical protein
MKLTNQAKTFPSRVQQLRAEAATYIDTEVESQRRECAGVPAPTIRNLLVAPYATELDAAIAILLSNQERN